MLIEPDYPFEGGHFQVLGGFPSAGRCEFGLVQAVDGFGECFVVRVALAADGRLDAASASRSVIADRNIRLPQNENAVQR